MSKDENSVSNQTRALLWKKEFNFENIKNKLKSRSKTCLKDENSV